VSAPILHLAVLQRPVFLLNSRLGLFTAAFLCFHKRKHPFSRSYGVILPSSLTRVLSLTLGFSPRLPVSVCGTGTSYLARSFSWQCEIRNFGTLFPSPSQLNLSMNGFSCSSASLLGRTFPFVRFPYPPASLLHSIDNWWYRNFYLLSIAYAFQPRLRSRLTLSGRAFLRKPWAFGGQDSHLSFATHTGILTSNSSTCSFDHASLALERSPTTDISVNPQLRCYV
jgi:hypothetical protein